MNKRVKKLCQKKNNNNNLQSSRSIDSVVRKDATRIYGSRRFLKSSVYFQIFMLINLFNFVISEFPPTRENDVNTTYISQILNRLTDKTKYDKRLRPLYGEDPVNVGITIHVSSISAVSEVHMDFTIDFYLRQTWQDPRLAFGKLDVAFGKIDSLTVGVDYLERLWKPDTFFPNEKQSIFHDATTHNSFLRIEPDGRVSTSQRLTVIATCPMMLKLFPLDTQKCKLEIESYGYTTADIDYFWGKAKSDKQESAVAFSDFTLPQFKRLGYRVEITKAQTSSGEYVRLYFEIILMRNLGFYLMNIIVPSILIVMVSWVSFWINRESSPARVNLGVITVLSITTVIITTNNQMPKVSYIKALDVFLNFCFLMVFSALVEYVVVAYLSKKLKMRKEKRKKLAENSSQNDPRLAVQQYPPPPPPDTSYNYRVPGLPLASPILPCGLSSIQQHEHDCDCRAIPLMQYPQQSHEPPPFYAMQVAYKKARRPTRFPNISPSGIDRCSRYAFPTLFISFNFIYWCIMKALSVASDNQEYVHF